MSSHLAHLAGLITEDLGPPHVHRVEYKMSVPAKRAMDTLVLDAAVFASPVPSIDSALIALCTSKTQNVESVVRALSYFGGQFAVIEHENQVSAFQYTAPLVGEPIGEPQSLRHAGEWVRNEISSRIERRQQLRLPVYESRELLLTEMKVVLLQVVSELVSFVAERWFLDNTAAFKVAMDVTRQLVLGHIVGDDARVHEATARYQSRFGLSHLPLDSIAELYEMLGVDAKVRRSTGVVYTPRWLARRLVDRLPLDSFLAGRAVDPTCGSGTFLITFLERMIEERSASHRLFSCREEDLIEAVSGLDIDPVAVESARLVLDMLAQRFGFGPLPWDVRVGDAVREQVVADTLIGNLPFGLRTHDGKFDISSVIIEQWVKQVPTLKNLAVIMPESFAYATKSAGARKAIRCSFRVEEIYHLPEPVFEHTKVETLAILATKAESIDTALVRDVAPRELESFKATGISRNYVTYLPLDLGDPWVLSPFFSEFSTANSRKAAVLGDLVEVHLGYELWNAGRDTTSFAATGRLESPRDFVSWAERPTQQRPEEPPPTTIRRSGPVDLFHRSKIIIRSNTNTRQKARLAAVVDTSGVWFSRKFIGLWPKSESANLLGLAAYLQTRFVETWLAGNNPSRRLRVGVLERLPVPPLPVHWWDKAADLVAPNTLVIAPRWREHTYQQKLLDTESVSVSAWTWFERAVDTAFGLDSSSSEEMELFLSRLLGVGALRSDD